MNYNQSYSNFRQYRPPKSKWQSFLSLFRKDKSVVNASLPIGHARTPNRQFNARYMPKDYTGRNIIALFLLFVAIVAWIWIVLYLPYFRVNKVVYLGLNLIKRSEIDAYIQNEILATKWSIPFNNYFLINDKNVERKLMEKFSLNSATVKKIFPGELRIDLEEKISTIIYDNGNKYYLLDTSGNILRYLAAAEDPEKNVASTTAQMPMVLAATSTDDNSTSSTLLIGAAKTHIPEYRRLRKDYGPFPILYDMRNLFLSDNDENILSDKYIAALIKWSEELDKQGIGAVKYMTTEHPLSGVAVYTSAPWVIYIQPADDFDRQMANLKAIVKENIPEEYVDLRFGDRLYWK